MQKSRGFTFVELLIVILVTAILAGSAMLMMGPANEAARRETCAALRKQVNMASQFYMFEHDGFPEDLDALVEAGYLDKIPVCPSGGRIFLSDAADENGFRQAVCTLHSEAVSEQEPLTPYGSTFSEISAGLIELVEWYHEENEGYPRSWGDYAFTDLGLDPEFWGEPKDHIRYSTGGSRLKIEPEDGYTLSVESLSGEIRELNSTLNWNLWYNFDDQTWYYHTIEPGNEIDITTLQVFETQ